MDMGLAGEEDLLMALGEQMGVPAIDLSRSIIPLEALDLVPAQVAEESVVLPVKVEANRVVLAMGNPDDQQTIDEIKFITGKKVDPYVTLEAKLKNVLREAYALRDRDRSVGFYRGERSAGTDMEKHPNGYLAILSEHLPEVEVVPDEEGINLEIVPEEQDYLELEIIPDDSPTDLRIKSHTVLVVDDEPNIVSLLEKALTTENFKVLKAYRGLEALQVVKVDQPNLVILDAMLPEIHGFEICRKIKSSKRFGHIPVIMISAIYRGWRFAEDVKKLYGADDYFEKPFRIVPLMRRVQELLDIGPLKVENEINPQAAQISYNKGVSLYKAKNYLDAEIALKEACEHDPFNPNIHFALANAMLANNKIFDAIREYEQTIELKPDLFLPLKSLAILYQKKGFKNKAIEMWERALRCSPQESARQEVRKYLLQLL